MFFKGPFWGAYFWRGLSTEGNLRFKSDWASFVVGSKFTVFTSFYFVFKGNFPSTSLWGGAYIWRGDLAEGPLHYRFGGLVHGGAYFWNFTVLHSFLNPCQTSYLLAKAVTCKLRHLTIRKIISWTTLSDTGSWREFKLETSSSNSPHHPSKGQIPHPGEGVGVGKIWIDWPVGERRVCFSLTLLFSLIFFASLPPTPIPPE